MSKQTHLVVLVVIERDGKFLLTKRHEVSNEGEPGWGHDMWQLPGGGVEWNETPEEAAVREAKEEIGVDVKLIKLVPQTFSRTDEASGWHGVFLIFTAETIPPQAPIVINEEASEFGFFSRAEAANLPALPLTLPVLSAACKG